jgi:hypothetical protein
MPRVRGLSGVDVALAVVAVVGAAFYFWTAATSLPITPGRQTDVYNQLTNGLLAGETSYPVRPPRGLLKLPDPYDPIANARYRAASLPGAPYGIHDLSLYKGKLYEYWGVAPALTLFLPWRILPVGELPQSLGVAVFAVLSLVFSLLLLRLLVRRLYPNAPSWAVVMGALGLAFGNAVPFLLRRPAVYEAAIAAGACFLMAGLYLLAAAWWSKRPRLILLAAASGCFGLAFNARPPLGVAAAILVGVAVLARHADFASGRRRRTVATALLAPFAVCVLLTLAWNAVRFDSPFEFGVRYQLAGVEISKRKMNQLAYLPPGIFHYAFSPPKFMVAFPYVSLQSPPPYPAPLPSGYMGDPTAGIAPSAPIVLFAIALPILWQRRRPGDGPGLVVATTLVALGTVTLIVLAFLFWLTTQRYEVDFGLPLIIGSLLVWLALLGRTRRRSSRWLTGAAGTLALLWGVFCGIGLSFTGYEDLLAIYHPATYQSLEDMTAPLPTVASAIAGHPLIAGVSGVLGVDPPGTTGISTSLGFGRVTVTMYAPSSQNVALQASVRAHPCSHQTTATAFGQLCFHIRAFDCKTAPRAFNCLPSRTPTSPARLVVVVRSPGRPAVIVPESDGVQQFPIHLQWGINRIVLETQGVIGTLEFNDIRLAPH